MTEPAGAPRVAAIVPAYNEQETLTDVITVLKSMTRIDEIFVVSDGSTDETVEIARALKVKAIHLLRNHGKGRAMAIGVAHTDAEVLLFVDGDILNLSEYVLDQLLEPVLSGASHMNVGIRHRGFLIDFFHRRYGPLLSGIRCLRREVFEAVPESHLEGFAIETGLNWACNQLGCRPSITVLYNLKHRVKEQKRGLLQGLRARYQMFAAVFRAWMNLTLERPGLRRSSAEARRPVLKPELEYINF